MVFPDLNSFELSSQKHKPLVPIRILSFVIDYFIFAPVISFLVLVFFHSGVDIYQSFPKSAEAQSVFGYLVLGYIILSTFFQALFISFMGATPGQYFLKLRVEFKNKQYPLFLQAWVRQLGFVISFVFLGLPFLKALADENGQCFYEKMTESQLVSSWPIDQDSYFYKAIDLDRKFWSASIATISTFLIALGLVMFWKNYQFVLTSPDSYAKMKNKKKSCTEFVHLESTDRLRYAIAMNLVGTVTDACLDQEADFVLWRNFTDDRALAYFAKFVSSNNDRLEGKYLKQACAEDEESEGCYWASVFVENKFASIRNNSEMSRTLLGKVLLYEFATKGNTKKRTQAFNDLKEYVEFKSVKKYLLLENLNDATKEQDVLASKTSLEDPKSRKPASFEPVKKESLLDSDEIKTLIEDL
ncbi:hypothetical protein CIK05_05310 [Bdellovibrio sp. qaytius]|nr:hypothetical protein CIK05_05310 [Bdellovibrio sp. qaytius]